MKMLTLAAAAALSLATVVEAATPLPPAAVYTDPAVDTAHPAHMEVMHIPSGGVLINGVAYVAAGAGPHPTVVLMHGLPGNEKNLDLAQTIRRAGWTAVTFNYRGAWGSPGSFSFRGNLADAKAVLAYIRQPEVAAKLQIDPGHLVIAGHSMGGWVTALTAAQDPGLKGAIMISAGDMGGLAYIPPAARLQTATENMEALAGVTAQSMADEMATLKPGMTLSAAAPGLLKLPLLVLTSDDGLAGSSDTLVAAIRKGGGTQVQTVHVATDHGWNSARVRLATEILTWLAALPK